VTELLDADIHQSGLNAIVEVLWDLHCRFVARSGNKAGSNDDLHFLALAVGGEAGEVLEVALRFVLTTLSLQNQVKKQWRGFGDEDREQIKEELGDAFVYWAMLARLLGVDVGAIPAEAVAKARRKIEELEGRY
jgi:NTP pyrophosphatase (non-canonical NTP hydrolase)